MGGETSEKALPKVYGTCSFCCMDSHDLYRCPRCKSVFCGLKCYRSLKHKKCSEDFYKSQIEEHLKLSEDVDIDSDDEAPTCSNSDEQPSSKVEDHGRLTFEEYMEKHRREDAKKSEEERNPQISIGANEELVIDPEDEPEYLQGVIEKALKDFDNMDEAEVNNQLAKLSLDINNEEQLLKKLTPQELKAFQQLAEQMFGIEQKSCFK